MPATEPTPTETSPAPESPAKWFLASRTIWGAIVSALGALSPDLAAWAGKYAQPAIVLLGVALTIYGRLQATHNLTPLPGGKP